MSRRRWVRAAMAAALVPPLLVVGSVSPSHAEGPAPKGKHELVQDLAPTKRLTAAKSSTSQLAKTDPTLLNRPESTPVEVVVKLDYDSVVTYDGGIPGYEATSPEVTGKALSNSAAEKKYESRIVGIEDAFLAEANKKVKNLKVGQKLRTVYGGVALRIPANKVSDVLSIKGVVAVQKDAVHQPLTDSSTDFIGANPTYAQLGGKPNAGKGVIFGVLDSGAWPEHPSFADQGNLGVPPAKADGTARACDFGDNPLTPANDPFVCNKKMIGGQAFLTGYLSDPARAAKEPYKTARDSNGHGTHTGTTSAGNALASAPVLGVERGPLNGVAPGAWVSVYKVCGIDGCFSSDSAAAVAQAIKDGVNAINFSISGGVNPYSDPVELAFLEAYKAGVFVSASAGNDGPGAGTANHLSPWVTTVGASTQKREFQSTLRLTSTDGATSTLTGVSITAGAGPLPVVLASAAPYSRVRCDAPAPAGIFTGKIVACERGGNARVEKGYNVRQGGAAGMILYNPALADVETDNHWLPTVHLASGVDFLAFYNAHPGITAQFTAGQKADGQPDVMAAFSSRGPAGGFIKPDVTAPGVQILAGHTPTPESPLEGPPGEYFQAIAGTSMSSPHVAGAGVLLKALHPDWTPGQIKSALMTTATTAVVKEDLTTPADPFDHGSGRIRVNVATTAGLTFDETYERFQTLGKDPLTAVHLNIPSVNVPVLPGKVTTVRKAKNVTGRSVTYRASTTSPSGSSISVSPAVFTLAPGKSIDLSITIRSSAPTAQYFGDIQLTSTRGGAPTQHLPVAFVPKQGEVKVSQTCAPATIKVLETSTCTVTAANQSLNDATYEATTNSTLNLPIVGATGATVSNPFTAKASGSLAGAVPGTPSLDEAGFNGYVPLDMFGITPEALGDEDLLQFPTPEYLYNGQAFSGVSVTSNGYLIPGTETSSEDVAYEPGPFPDPARPNNVLAPFWSDLNGTGAPGVFVATLRDGTGARWTVVEWRVFVFGTTSLRTFQVWLGHNGAQDVSFSYNLSTISNPGIPYLIGAENPIGTGGEALPAGALPTGDLLVRSTDPVAGASVSYTVKVLGLLPLPGRVTTSFTSTVTPGTTIVSSPVTVESRHRARFD